MRLLNRDAYTGVTEYFKTDPSIGKNVILSVQDAEPFINRSAQLAEGLNKKEEWWYVGSIPDVIVLKWAQESNSKPYSKKWQHYAMKQMNHPDYRKFNPNRIKLDARER